MPTCRAEAEAGTIDAGGDARRCKEPRQRAWSGTVPRNASAYELLPLSDRKNSLYAFSMSNSI